MPILLSSFNIVCTIMTPTGTITTPMQILSLSFNLRTSTGKLLRVYHMINPFHQHFLRRVELSFSVTQLIFHHLYSPTQYFLLNLQLGNQLYCQMWSQNQYRSKSPTKYFRFAYVSLKQVVTWRPLITLQHQFLTVAFLDKKLRT